nr:hypothetical protein [Tanacetum cinerariifolium]
PKSSISDVFQRELSVVETSKNEALSEEFHSKEYDKNVDESGDETGSESKIISVLTGQVSCDKYVSVFYECESSKLYYTDPKEYSFIKSRNENLLEDSVAKQSVEKEIEPSDGKRDSAISNVLNGEISCQNLVKEQLQSRDMCIQSITNQFVQHRLESPKGKRPKSSISDVFQRELSVVETSKNEALS